MKTEIEITKLRNNIGTVHFCMNCGREIEHAFQVGTKVYGSECVKKLFVNTEKEVKNQLFFAKAWNGVSEASKKRSMEILKMTEDQLFKQYIKTGQI